MDTPKGRRSAMPPLQNGILGGEEMTEQQTAQSLVVRFPKKVIVEGDCGHPGKKDRHHPDYSKPFNVILLCRSCHKALDVRKYRPMHEKNIGLLSRNIRAFRLSAGLSQRDLSAKIGMSAQRLHAIEELPDGKSITTWTLAILMDALHKEASDFFIDTES
jgi:DNA-binding XRE family transcriptional regulator